MNLGPGSTNAPFGPNLLDREESMEVLALQCPNGSATNVEHAKTYERTSLFFSTPLHQDLRLPLASIATCLLQKSPDPPSYRCRRTPSWLQGARCKSGHRSLAALAGVARSDEGQSPVGLRLCEGTTNRSHPNRLQWHLAAIPASLPASESYPKPVSRAHGKALRRNIQLRSRPHQLHSKKCCGNPRRALWPLKQARLD